MAASSTSSDVHCLRIDFQPYDFCSAKVSSLPPLRLVDVAGSLLYGASKCESDGALCACLGLCLPSLASAMDWTNDEPMMMPA